MNVRSSQTRCHSALCAQLQLAGVAARLEVGVRVVADEVRVLVVAVEQPAEVVAAALHGHHDERAGRGHLHVGAGRRGRELLDRVVVEVEPGAGFAFGGVDAVGEDPVLAPHAEALVAGLLALVGAADVEAAHPDARGLAEHRPDIGGRRHLLQLGGAEVVHQRGGPDVHHRRGAGHRDGFGHGRQLQRRVDPDHPAAFHDDPFADQRLEPGQLERNVVRTAPERPEAVRPVDEGNRELRRNQRLARERHRGTRHGQPLAVRHRPFNRAQCLPECRRNRSGRQQPGHTPSVRTIHLAEHRVAHLRRKTHY